MSRLDQQMHFIMEIDQLKQIMRQSYLRDASRKENDAEHSWHLALMAMVLQEYAKPEVDLLRVIKMVLVHDLVEIDAGDTFCYDDAGMVGREAREGAAADRIFGMLPSELAAELRGLWEEFEANATPDAHFANALDRIEPLLLNYHTQGKSWHEHGITAERVLSRNQEVVMRGSQALGEYITALIQDAETRGYMAAPREEET